MRRAPIVTKTQLPDRNEKVDNFDVERIVSFFSHHRSSTVTAKKAPFVLAVILGQLGSVAAGFRTHMVAAESTTRKKHGD